MDIRHTQAILDIIIIAILCYQFGRFRMAKDTQLLQVGVPATKQDIDKPEDIINMINYIMDLEMAYAIELPFEGKDVKRITDFEIALKDLTSNTVSAFSKEFFERAKLAGFNEDYLLEYITRGCTTRILKYIQENNAGYITQTETTEEE